MFVATHHGTTQRMVSTGGSAKMSDKAVSGLMSADCPGTLGLLRKMQLGSGTSQYKHTLEPQVACIFFSKVFPEQSQFSNSSLPPFFSSPFCRREECRARQTGKSPCCIRGVVSAAGGKRLGWCGRVA